MADLTINGGSQSQTLDGTHSYDNVNITNGGILYVTPYNGTGTTGTLILNVTNNVTIDSTSSINGTGRGYLGGASGGAGGTGPGAGGNGGSYVQCYAGGRIGGGGGGGAGYGTVGGNGGNGSGNSSCSPIPGGSAGPTYGTSNGTDITIGSGAGGGGTGDYAGSGGGPGGAAITINAQNIVVSGSILANGGNGGNGGSGNQVYSHPGYGGSGGGASGGGIKLIASSNVNINNATITANGGGGATTGGGGRIKIYYGTLNNTGTTINAGTIYYETTAGSASFTSSPTGARIWIDNIDQLVNTPSTITGISTGSHTYKLVSGIYTATGSFIVTTGMTTNVPITIAVTALSISSNTYTCTGTCQVTITTTWINNGNTDITFRPAITVDTVPAQYASDITMAAGGTSNPIAIVTSVLPSGEHTICPLPN